MSLDDFSFSSVSFSSEVGIVLKAAFKRKQNQIYLIYVERSCFNKVNFFAYFFVSRQKSKWGLGQSPVIKYLKIKNITAFTIFLSCTKILNRSIFLLNQMLIYESPRFSLIKKPILTYESNQQTI